MKQMLSYRTVLLLQTGICSWDSSDGIEEYTTSVTGFINKCIDDVIPTVTVRTYPNQKPWITESIRFELKPRAAAFKERASLTQKLIRNPAMPSNEESNRQSINNRTKIRSYYTDSDSPVAGIANHYRLQREAQPRAAQ